MFKSEHGEHLLLLLLLLLLPLLTHTATHPDPAVLYCSGAYRTALATLVTKHFSDMRAAGQLNMSECLRCKGRGKCGDGAQRLWVPVSSGGNNWKA